MRGLETLMLLDRIPKQESWMHIQSPASARVWLQMIAQFNNEGSIKGIQVIYILILGQAAIMDLNLGRLLEGSSLPQNTYDKGAFITYEVCRWIVGCIRSSMVGRRLFHFRTGLLGNLTPGSYGTYFVLYW